MEGSQGSCTETHSGVHDLSAEQIRADTPCGVTSASTHFCSDTPRGVTSASTHFGAEMGEHFYGLHYRFSSSAG
jgi:hypothetical protein